jgi:xanthine dehydrogenase accessory factor
MIGSATKRATFRNWLARETAGTVSVDRLVLPIGGTTVRDKRPAIIAALVAAELLTVYASLPGTPS